MATTTNYSWTTPDDTDLVKNGASAIRTLGSAVDSTLKTQIDAQVPKSTFTTKGDILQTTAASTVSRLAVGTNGQVLTADSASTGGIKWATPSSAAYNEQVFTSSGTWTAPAGVTKAELIVVGAGGGGGGANSGTRFVTGGSAGGQTQQLFTVTPSTGYTVTIGAGGSGSTGAAGAAGSDSSFSTVTGTGGAGGLYMSGTSASLYTQGQNGYGTGAGANTGSGGTGAVVGGSNGGSGIVIVRWLA